MRPDVIQKQKRWRPSFQDYLVKMAWLFKELKYEPHSKQWEFHRSTARIRMLAGGVRAGKSFCSAKDGLARMVYEALYKKQQRIWIIGPDYEQPRVEFQYILDDLLALGFKLRGKPSMPRGKSSPWIANIGYLGYIETKTASDTRKLASVPPDGIIMAEAAQQPVDVYFKARERLAEKRGWLIMSGTFETSLGWFQDYWTRWQGPNPEGAKSFSMPSWTNTKVFPGGREDPEIKAIEASMPADLFMERFGAVPYRPHTLVFKEFDVTVHVRDDIGFDSSKPVYLAVDPGYEPGYYHVSALQVHVVENEGEPPYEVVYQIDEMHYQNKTGPEIVAMAKNRRWWPNVKDGVIDVAGRQHHAMRSQVEVWREEGGVWLRSQPVPILDGIERHRTFLRDPGTGRPRLFHASRCINTIAEYSQYRRPEDKDGKALKLVPIDRHNHAMKAIAYWLYDRYGPVYRRRRKPGRTAIV